MTREERERAIEILKSEISEPYIGEFTEEQKCVAIRTAIEALSEPTTIKKAKEEVLMELLNYTYGMLTTEKFGLQGKIASMLHDIGTDSEPTTITENMTNGDVIKAMFPTTKVVKRNEYLVFVEGIDEDSTIISFFVKWFDEPYKGNFTMPTRPKAKWIDHIDSFSSWVECSECGSERAYHTKFCPDCGAEMESE